MTAKPTHPLKYVVIYMIGGLSHSISAAFNHSWSAAIFAHGALLVLPVLGLAVAAAIRGKE